MGDVLVRVGVCCASAGIAALAIGFALQGGLLAGSADAGSQPGADVFARIDPEIFAREPLSASQVSLRPSVRLASLDMDIPLSAADDDAAPLTHGASFEERFSSVARRVVASFDERFAPRVGPPMLLIGLLPQPRLYPTVASADPAKSDSGRSARAAADIAIGPPAAAAPPKTRLASLEAPDNPLSMSDADSRTAIYDIGARAVYMPDGTRLEAHSGLGSHMDDIHSATIKMHGVTPPGVYTLSLREALFHGVRAIRLNPVDESKMYGRAGILAHPFMLGPNGQSNGCVSFKDYAAFLAAFQRGQVDRLVVVERLANPPPTKGGSGWIAQALHKLFKSSDEPAVASSSRGSSGGQYAAAFQ